LTLMTVIHLAADQIGGGMATVLQEASMVFQFEDFTRGVLSLRGVVYYLSVVVVFLFLATRTLELRRWR
jgi:ABC-2 type transport system permease protein